MQLLRAWVGLGYFGYPTFEHSTDCTCCAFDTYDLIMALFKQSVPHL
jgi:hypothetical protein